MNYLTLTVYYNIFVICIQSTYRGSETNKSNYLWRSFLKSQHWHWFVESKICSETGFYGKLGKILYYRKQPLFTGNFWKK